MTEPLFFAHAAGVTVGEIVALTGAKPRDGASLSRRITNIAPLDRAGPSDLTFFDNTKYADALEATQSGACLIAERLEGHAPAHLTTLRTGQPYRAFVTVARKLFPDAMRPSSLFETKGTAPSAFVHPSARIESGVTIDPGAVVGPRAEIGAGTVIGATAVIGPLVRIGRDCAVGSGCSITHSLIGDRVIIHPGCHIGQDGFGYLMGVKGHEKVPQVGRVIIQDDVEIGANTTIDRGGIRDTVIGEGTKIDNLVQIGHNVQIGRQCILVSQVGISGSSIIEDYAVLGGQVGVADHVTIGAGAMVAAKGGVMGDVPPGEKWGGYPARPIREWLRGIAVSNKLGQQGRTAGKALSPATDGDGE